MTKLPDASPKLARTKVIRDKGFAKRMIQACENHARAPSGHGQQRWLKDQLESKFSTTVSTEGVRKWFAGESRPKPKLMALVARVLEVDEAWLSLGITPLATPIEKKKQNAMAAGAVNLVAAQIQMCGGNIAFPDGESPFDIFAIIGGKQHSLIVRSAENQDQFTLHFPLADAVTVIVLPTEEPTRYRFFRLPNETLAEEGKARGDYLDVQFSQVADRLIAGNNGLPEILDFRNLDGVKRGLKTTSS